VRRDGRWRIHPEKVCRIRVAASIPPIFVHSSRRSCRNECASRGSDDEQSGRTDPTPDGATVHVVGVILFVWLLRVLLVRRIVVAPVVIIGAMLVVIGDLCTGAAESTSRVWKLTAESTVLCKVRAAKRWDVVFGEQLWRALGYVVVVTLGLIVGGAVVGALVLRYCEAGGIGDLALHVSCKPLLLVTLLSAIGKQCVRSLFGRSAAWNVRSPRTQVLDYADCASLCARPLNGAERGLLPGCRRTTATLARADVLVVA
jgi:hypothetical protein